MNNTPGVAPSTSPNIYIMLQCCSSMAFSSSLFASYASVNSNKLAVYNAQHMYAAQAARMQKGMPAHACYGVAQQLENWLNLNKIPTLYTFLGSVEPLEDFLRTLPVSGATLKAVILAGDPGWYCEELCQRSLSFRHWEAICNNFMDKGSCDLHKIIETVGHCLGREHVHVLGTRDGSLAAPNALMERVVRLIDPEAEGEFQPVEAPCCTPEIYELCFPHRLAHIKAIFSRQEWYALVQAVLKRHASSPRWVSSPHMRTAVRQRALASLQEASQRYPELRQVLADTAAQAAHPAQEDWTPYAGISVERMREFCQIIPEDKAKACVEALRAHAPVLIPLEHLFAQCIAENVYSQPKASAFHLFQAPPLSVLTMAYNQKDYIAQCLDSVIAQKTSFPVEHIVVDDASDDGTQEIIASYARRHPHIRAIFLPQRGLHPVQSLFNHCRTQYAALCDGDDYFTDPLKLQKQVDYLEAHPECALCFHPVRVVYDDNSVRERIYPPQDLMPRGVRPFYYLADLLKANFIQTNSVVYRWRFKNGLPRWFRTDLVPSDWYWHLLHAENGKIGFINEVMSVYRRHKNSVYYSAENTESTVSHRTKHGIRELDTYNAINAHFNKRYFRAITGFTNNVLVDFLHHAHVTGNDSLLQKAGELFPEFMEVFLRDVRIVRSDRNSSCGHS